jgi:site-specific DNA-cytosine methylase
MRYAGMVKPEIIVFECVQQAFTQGRDSMLQYRKMVEEISGKKYDLHHVMHNNLQLGGFSYRPRYFWVATRRGMKFGASVVEPKTIPLVMDIIGDLEQTPQSWEEQKIIGEPSKYVKPLRRRDGKVDGHIGIGGLHEQRVTEIFDIIGNEGWKARDHQEDTLRVAYEKNGNKFPQSWLSIAERVKSKNFTFGFSQPSRWAADSWCNVLTGGGLYHVVHPTQPRLLTHREAARMQGLPDDWRIEGVKNYSQLKSTWGKAVAAQAGRWIGETVIAALDGQPSGPDGEKIGDHEFMHHTDKGFSRHYARKKWITKD